MQHQTNFLFSYFLAAARSSLSLHSSSSSWMHCSLYMSARVSCITSFCRVYSLAPDAAVASLAAVPSVCADCPSDGANARNFRVSRSCARCADSLLPACCSSRSPGRSGRPPGLVYLGQREEVQMRACVHACMCVSVSEGVYVCVCVSECVSV